jgi:DNA polymerase III beta subunit, central domain
VIITVKHRDLALVCKLLATVAPKRSATLPILETVRVESTGECVHLDVLRFVGEAAVRLRATLALSADPGLLAVRFRDLREATKGGSRYGYDDTTLHVDGDQLEVTGQAVKGGRLALADPADWPDPIDPAWQPWATLPGSAVPWLGAVATAAAGAEEDERESPRIALGGVQLRTDPKRGTLTAAATNSYRLHTVTKPAKEVADGLTRLVPAEAVKALAAAASLLEDAHYDAAELPLTLEQTDTAVRMRFGPVTLTTTTINAAFPNWQQLVPTPGTRDGELAIAVTDPRRLVDLLGKLPKAILDANTPLKLTFAGGGATAEANVGQHSGGNGWTMHATATLPMALPDAPTGMVAYNPLFLRDLFAAAAAGWPPHGLTFHVIADGWKPALLTERDGTDGDGFAGLIMQVRLPEQGTADGQA